jgi:hypothetical protein
MGSPLRESKLTKNSKSMKGHSSDDEGAGSPPSAEPAGRPAR